MIIIRCKLGTRKWGGLAGNSFLCNLELLPSRWIPVRGGTALLYEEYWPILLIFILFRFLWVVRL